MSHTVRGKKKLLARVHRIQGQLAALEKQLDGEGDCYAILQQAAACRGGLNALTAEIIEGHIRHHIVNPDKDQEGAEAALQLIDVIKSYLR